MQVTPPAPQAVFWKPGWQTPRRTQPSQQAPALQVPLPALHETPCVARAQEGSFGKGVVIEPHVPFTQAPSIRERSPVVSHSLE